MIFLCVFLHRKCSGFGEVFKVNPLQKPAEFVIADGQHTAVLRDLKAAFLQAFIKQTKAIAIPIQQLNLIPDSVAKNINCAACGVLFQHPID